MTVKELSARLRRVKQTRREMQIKLVTYGLEGRDKAPIRQMLRWLKFYIPYLEAEIERLNGARKDRARRRAASRS